jgi:lipopolysaccharide/colanic/teichoic acid biosynthesis glycosyltransferase
LPLLLDLLLACLLLPILLPVILAVSLVLFLSQGRPIFFHQNRVGRNFRLFRIYKFRTMTVRRRSEEGGFDAGSRERITPIGSFLRKTKLDELPQIYNVLKGDMSFVGPRPEVKKWVECYREEWKPVLSIRPGITDPASIEYRDEEKLLAEQDKPEKYYAEVILPHKLEIYQEYVKNKSIFLDAKVCMKTLKKVFFR